MSPEDLMQLAMDAARSGMAAGQSPFGCAIAREGVILSVRHNAVAASVDITAHAEINALRSACTAANDIFLSGAVVATTCEPCPMCMAALHWARVKTVYFGAAIADAQRAGFNELAIPATEMIRQGGSDVQLVGDVLRSECAALFDQWLQNPQRVAY